MHAINVAKREQERDIYRYIRHQFMNENIFHVETVRSSFQVPKDLVVINNFVT